MIRQKINPVNVFQLFIIVLLLFQTSCMSLEKRAEPFFLPGSMIIDHECIDLDKIPKRYIDDAKNKINFYYAHTSHGGQSLVGLELIQKGNAEYAVAIDRKRLPGASNAVSILDHRYVDPEGFWAAAKGQSDVEAILDLNCSINLCMWAWCGQLGSYSPAQVQEYLEAIAAFEKKYPDVTFVYMTGHAQYGGKKGYTRFVNNNIIRQWVRKYPDKKRILFDFADLDCWWKNKQSGKWEHATYSYWNGSQYIDVPIEHLSFHGNEQSHTTYESCLQKGKAAWWMFAVLTGWGDIWWT